MKPTPQTCAQVRELLLADRQRVELHAAGCPDCAKWLERQGSFVGILGSMERLVAPAELEERVEAGFVAGNGAILGALRGLKRLEAPEQLEERLAASLVMESEPELAPDTKLQEPASLPLLRGLEKQVAPKVLDRLVREELADPAAALTRRFAGGLFRKASPQILSAHVEDDLPQAPETAVLRSRWIPLGSAAAAALLIWMASPVLFRDTSKPTPRFRVIQVESLASMDPLAKSLVEGFAGGRVHSMDPREDSEGGEL